MQPLAEVVRNIHNDCDDVINTVGKKVSRSAPCRRSAALPRQRSRPPRSAIDRVTARCGVLRRIVQLLYPEVVKAIDWADSKFDAQVELTSIAAKELKAKAELLVETHPSIAISPSRKATLSTVGSVPIDPAKMVPFEHAAHEGYSDLKKNELEFVRELDATGALWARNPSNGGFAIPILEKGTTRNFYPDFLVWKGDLVFALDRRATTYDPRGRVQADGDPG